MNKQTLTKLAEKVYGLGAIPLAATIILALLADGYLQLSQASSPEYKHYQTVLVVVLCSLLVISVLVPLCAAVYLDSLDKHAPMSYARFLRALRARDRPPTSTPGQLPIVLLHEGHDRQVTKVFRGKQAGHAFEGIGYSCVTYSLSERTNVPYNYLIVHFSTTHAFPYVLLNPVVDEVNSVMGVHGSVAGTEKLQVEGSFNDSYDVIIQSKTGAAVLQLLTPDFMSELLDAKLPAAIEFAGHDVHIVLAGTIYPEVWSEMLDQIQRAMHIIWHHLGDISATWQASSTPQEIARISRQVEQLR